MAHFAKLDENNTVTDVLVVDNKDLYDSPFPQSESVGVAFLTTWANGEVFNWKQTSYNGNFRKNYAGIGYVYDSSRDAFIPPKDFNSWVLNEDTCRWEPPVPIPQDGKAYIWDESITNWTEVTE
jgi:hypothetical protein